MGGYKLTGIPWGHHGHLGYELYPAAKARISVIIRISIIHILYTVYRLLSRSRYLSSFISGSTVRFLVSLSVAGDTAGGSFRQRPNISGKVKYFLCVHMHMENHRKMVV